MLVGMQRCKGGRPAGPRHPRPPGVCWYPVQGHTHWPFELHFSQFEPIGQLAASVPAMGSQW